jgi:hypothetical protein
VSFPHSGAWHEGFPSAEALSAEGRTQAHRFKEHRAFEREKRLQARGSPFPPSFRRGVASRESDLFTSSAVMPKSAQAGLPGKESGEGRAILAVCLRPRRHSPPRPSSFSRGGRGLSPPRLMPAPSAAESGPPVGAREPSHRLQLARAVSSALGSARPRSSDRFRGEPASPPAQDAL